ncbi:MAG TPA: hypothetical protein VHB25_00540 [Gemmatimonadaceae bacterium]|nr:hypothetical protein [Gemmatimonadaceae bacterium]
MSSRAYAAIFALGCTLAACGPRQVEVRTAPTAASQLQVRVSNNLTQAVNVYVTQSGVDTFLRQVSANSQTLVPVQGVAAGTTVTLKAVTIDGTKTYTRDNVVLSGTYNFPVP